MTGQGFINRPMSIALDAVRGAAALVVLMGHAVQHRLYTGPWPFTTIMQHNAVVVFFVLSGLVIANSAFSSSRGAGDYVAARVARVMPVALFALAFSLLAYGIGQALDLQVIRHGEAFQGLSAAGLILPLLFLSESWSGVGPVWNPPFWSLVYEVWYYALFGAAFYLSGWRRWALLALMLPIAGVRVLLLLPCWLAGVALARWAPARPVGQGTALACIVAGLAMLPLTNGVALDSADWLAATTGLGPEQIRFSAFALTDALFALGMAAFFIGLRPLADQRAALLERWQRPIRWLADCSFTLYLLHWPILNLLHGLGISAGGNPLLFALLLAAIVAACGQVARLTEHRRGAVRAWLQARLARTGDTPSRAMPRLLRLALSVMAAALLAMVGWGSWLVADAPLEHQPSVRTASYLMRAPFADRVVIGDSRVEWADPVGDAVFAGYAGATIGDMRRLTATLCDISHGDVVIALGANDAKPDARDPAAALAALAQMVDHCGADRVLLSEVWPTDPSILPLGEVFDAPTIAALNAGIRDLAARTGARLIEAPQLAGHTRDGVHFNDATAYRYMAMLGAASGA